MVFYLMKTHEDVKHQKFQKENVKEQIFSMIESQTNVSHV